MRLVALREADRQVSRLILLALAWLCVGIDGSLRNQSQFRQNGRMPLDNVLLIWVSLVSVLSGS